MPHHLLCLEPKMSLLFLFQHWSKISKPVDRSVKWPEERVGHAGTCVSGPVLVIVGGIRLSILSECWICDTTDMLWKKV